MEQRVFDGGELAAEPPRFAPEEAAAIAAEHFGLAGDLTPLGSERDQNLRITTASGERFVLKLANAAEASSSIQMQTAVLLHGARVDPDLPLPRVIASKGGDTEVSVEGPTGERHLVRVLTYVDGEEVDAAVASLENLRATGETVARLDECFASFSHPGAKRSLLWDPRRAPELESLLPYVADDDRRALAARALERYRERISPAIGDLRTQVVHCDLHSGNLLIDPADDRRISGIIDFGDVMDTVLLAEIGVTLADYMGDRADPFEASREILAGYLSRIDLTARELSLLPEFIRTRSLSLVLMAAWRVTLDPENEEYLNLSVPSALRLLQILDDLDPDALPEMLFG